MQSICNQSGLGSAALLVAAFLVFFLLCLAALLLGRLAALLAGLTGLLLAGLSTLLTLLSLLAVFLHIVCHVVFLPWVRIAAHSTFE